MRKATRYLFTTLLMTLVLCFLGVTHVFAQVGEEPDMKPVADAMMSSSGISWMPKVNYTKLILNISRPDGTIFSKTFANGASPYVNLADLMTGQYIEGSYTYELCAVSAAGNNVRRNDGFSTISSETRAQEALTQTGYFTVRGGMIVTPGAAEPENVISTAQDGLSGTKDQLILDDLIVDGSACIGFDCYNGENFGFDTLRLKENNLRIKFQDTSTSASFPSNDWQITANDSENGGANKFSIDDIDSGRTPFTIEAGTRANALYVDDSGRVGLGTSTPVEDLHIWYGDTPTIRLHQSGSGWAPQTWDVAGNEANFFIRDVTNGSELPFRIKPGADSNSLFIASDNDIGFGTDNPGDVNHLTGGGTDSAVKAHFRSNGNVKLVLDNKSNNVGLVFTAGGSQTHIGSMTDHEFRFYVNNDWRMRLNNTSNTKDLEMRDGAYSDGTDWFPSSSREVKENIKNLSVDNAVEALKNLNPVTYNYKQIKEDMRVGFIAEDVPELVAVNGRKHLNAMDIVAVLTKVVQEQQKTINELKKEIAELKKKQ